MHLPKKYYYTHNNCETSNKRMGKSSSSNTGEEVPTAVGKLTRRSWLKKLPAAMRSPRIITYRLWYDDIGRKVGILVRYPRSLQDLPTV